MSILKARLAAGLLSLCLLGGCGEPIPQPTDASQAPEASEAATLPPRPVLNPCLYIDSQLLARQEARAETVELPGLRALIAPHYAPQLDLLVGPLKALGEQRYDLVVVIGPDHTGQGGGVTLTGRGWDTPEGVVPGGGEAARALLADTDIRAAQNHDLLSADHAVSTLMPYVARWLPETPAVGILLGKYTGLGRLNALAGALDALGQSERLLVIFSLDFSHYQTLPDAQRYDAETVGIIEALDTAALLALGNDHLDSPEAAAVFIELARLWQLAPRLLETSRNTFVENGVPMAGSFMAWALADAP